MYDGAPKGVVGADRHIVGGLSYKRHQPLAHVPRTALGKSETQYVLRQRIGNLEYVCHAGA